MLTLFLALGGIAGGWLAGAWFYRRKVEAMRLQLKATRQTTADHLAQMKRQIAQLQGEIANRPAQPARPGAAPAPAPVNPAVAAKAAEAAAQARREAAAKMLEEGDKAAFGDTQPHGFARTQVLNDIPTRGS